VQRVLSLTLLGGFEARPESGSPVTFPRKKSEALLAYLAIHAGQMQARDKLAALLWGDASDARARHSLRQALMALRQTLPRGTVPLLLEEGDTVGVNPAAVELDVTLFERLVRDGNPSALERAAALYRGDLLEGLAVAEPPFEEWLTLERERLREKALEALVRLLAHQIRVGAAEPAMQTAIRVLGLDPTQEAVHRSLMRLYAADGRRGAALRQYQICVGVLERELGAEPEAETKELYRELLQAAQGQRILEPNPARSEIPLIGRQLELARLHAALDAALQGRGAVALVQGEWGVGKSRLVAAVVARAAERGGHVLLGRAYESEQILPFSPWVDALRAGRVIPHMVQELNDPWRMELARLFPELGRGDTEPPAGEDYVRLFEAMTRVVQYLASGQPLLVVLEDLHWADDMSLRLLVFLSRRIPDWPVLVIGTFRVEELADALVLRRSVAQLAQQSRSLSLSLAALSERESMALVRALMRAGREESVVTRIAQTVWRVSAGNPFMVVEAVRMLEGRDPATGPEDVVIPQAVRAVIAGRLERLTDRGRRLAGVASVIGREFDFTVLSDAAELSAAETAEGVEELVGRRILQAVGEALDFTHDRIRDVAYELVLPAHRRLLHRAVAGALESRAAGDVAAQALALGRHYAAAEAWNRAWPYLAQAGARAARRYAHREAIACFEQAISALGRLPPGRELIERSIDLRLELRHSCVPVRDHDRILEHLREAEEAATSLADRHRLGWILVYRIHGLFLAGAGKGGLEIGQRALALAAEVGDPGLQESASFYLAQVHHWAGNYRQGADLLRRTVSSLEDELARLGMPAKQYVNCRMILAWCLAELGVFGEALTYAQEAIAAAEKRATAYDLVHAYSGAGLVHLRRGDFRAAATTAGRAVELCQGRDFSALWAMSASIVGPAYVALGQITEAIALLEHAAEIVAALAAPVLGFLAEAYMVAGRLQEARATADRAIQLATDGGEQGWLAWSLRLLGELAARNGSRDEAAQHYVRALQLAEGLGMRPLAAHCHRGLGGSHLDAAISMYREMDMRAFLAPS
jgi:DNA-binding SARP family transcriptional activator/tetratricopeptide (TPR) repeat protein